MNLQYERIQALCQTLSLPLTAQGYAAAAQQAAPAPHAPPRGPEGHLAIAVRAVQQDVHGATPPGPHVRAPTDTAAQWYPDRGGSTLPRAGDLPRGHEAGG